MTKVRPDLRHRTFGKRREVADYIRVGQGPWHLELSPDHKKLYVANGLTNDMTVIDVDTLKAEKLVKLGRLPC